MIDFKFRIVDKYLQCNLILGPPHNTTIDFGLLDNIEIEELISILENNLEELKDKQEDLDEHFCSR